MLKLIARNLPLTAHVEFSDPSCPWGSEDRGASVAACPEPKNLDSSVCPNLTLPINPEPSLKRGFFAKDTKICSFYLCRTDSVPQSPFMPQPALPPEPSAPHFSHAILH